MDASAAPEARPAKHPAFRLAIASAQQFWAGVLFALLGVGALVGALGYPLGTTARIGPGYFPMCLSVLLIALGLASVVRGLQVQEAPIGHWPVVPLGFVLAGVAAFAVLIGYTGLVESGLALILLVCYRRLLRHPLEVAAITVVLLAFVVLLFIKFLNMPFDAF